LFSKRADPELERLRQDLAQLKKDSEEPMGADEAALLGAKIWRRLCESNAKFEAATGESGVGTGGGEVFVDKGLTELIKKDEYCEFLEVALSFYPRSYMSHRFNEAWPSVVAKYRGKPNSEELLREKSNILAHFVVHNLDVAIIIFEDRLVLNREKNAPQLSFEKTGGLTKAQEASIRLEEAVLWYRVISERAHLSLAIYELDLAAEAIDHTQTKMTSPQKKAMTEWVRKTAELFMDYFEGDLAYFLALQGITPYAICNTLADRGREYASYREWSPQGSAPFVGTLLWEAAKHIGEPLGARGNAFFLVFARFFFERWQQALIYELLTGRTKSGDGASSDADC
jgi:hypothetical protein